MEMKLYEIAANLENALMADDFNEEEVNSLVQSMEEKAGAIVYLADKINLFTEYCKAEEQRIANIRKASENKRQRALDYLQNCMESAGMVKLPIGTKTAVIQKNPPAVVIEDPNKINKAYIEVVYSEKIDKMKIKKELLEGVFIEGAHLEQKLSLRIK